MYGGEGNDYIEGNSNFSIGNNSYSVMMETTISGVTGTIPWTAGRPTDYLNTEGTILFGIA
jgi:hypothetical protein